eukprot:COSAG03_NODE_18609_length_351_cov_1.579365_2_plen_51_part_01
MNLQRDDAVVVRVAGVAEQAGLVHAALREVHGARALRATATFQVTGRNLTG